MTPEFITAIIEGIILLGIGYWMGHIRGWSRGYGDGLDFLKRSYDRIEVECAQMKKEVEDLMKRIKL